MNKETQTNIEAAVFRRFLKHLDDNKDVQNIDLMILADFCRNCLAKWYITAAEEEGEAINYDKARELIYGMSYDEWKNKYQTKATEEQMIAYQARQDAKKNNGSV